MFLVATIAVVLAVLLGLAGKLILATTEIDDYEGRPFSISWPEFVAVGLLMVLVITPSVLAVGKKMSVANIVTYQQWLNGVETEPVDDVTSCYAGHSGDSESSGHSNCDYTYVSGTYTYPVTYTVMVCESDGKGGTTCHSETRCCHYPSANIYTPYATREHNYSIPSTFGFKDGPTYSFRGVYLDANPQPFGHRAIPSSYPRGAPKDWLDAKAHWDAGDSRPVTDLDSYPNYILASKDKVLNAYSIDIDRFKKASLLPAQTAGIMTDPMTGRTGTQAKKLSFVGVSVPNTQEWQDALMRYNAALGMGLQGDLHVVLIDASKVSEQDAVPYLNALKAYWQGPAFKKRALAKNGIILVLGISNNSTIEWAEASTGMPVGNENMAQHIHDYLPGTALNPTAIFGEPRTFWTGDKAAVTHPSPEGVLEQIMFETTPFARASMKCDSKEDHCVGFDYLLDKIEPTKKQKIVMLVITTLLAGLLWLIVGFSSFIDDYIQSFRGGTRSNESEIPDYLYDPSRDCERKDSKKKGNRQWTS